MNRKAMLLPALLLLLVLGSCSIRIAPVQTPEEAAHRQETGETGLSAAVQELPNAETEISDFPEPPGLQIVCGGRSVPAYRSSFTWMRRNADGTGSGISADGLHPLQYWNEDGSASLLPTLRVTEGSETELVFELTPDEITVRCWPEESARSLYTDPGQLADALDQGVELPVTDGRIAPPGYGDYLYEVVARWADDSGSGGTAIYGFRTRGDPLTFATIEYQTFEEVVSRCTDILVGTYLGEEESDGVRRCAFSVEERLKGGTEAQDIRVYLQRAYVCATAHSGAYITGDYLFAPGTRYLLILERHRSVFFREDQYLLLGDVFLPLEGGKEARMYDEPLEKHWACPASGSEGEITEYIRQLIPEDEANSPEAWGPPFIEAQSFAEAEEAAELVLRVRIEALFLAGRTAPTETWSCRILDSRKGDLDYLEGDPDVLVTLPAGAAKPGREYWICVNKPDEYSRIFVPVSRENSLREAED